MAELPDISGRRIDLGVEGDLPPGAEPSVHDARAALLERGIAVTDPSVRWNSTYVEFFDPEGTRIELWSTAP